MIKIRIIDAEHKQDINIPNEPFSLFGRMIPSYINEQWKYDIVRFKEEEICEMCFPDENYDYDKLSKNSIFVGAYEGGKCVGLAILQHAMMKYMYLYDLKVNREYRGLQIGKMLIENIAVQLQVVGPERLAQHDHHRQGIGPAGYGIRKGHTVG